MMTVINWIENVELDFFLTKKEEEEEENLIKLLLTVEQLNHVGYI